MNDNTICYLVRGEDEVAESPGLRVWSGEAKAKDGSGRLVVGNEWYAMEFATLEEAEEEASTYKGKGAVVICVRREIVSRYTP